MKDSRALVSLSVAALALVAGLAVVAWNRRAPPAPAASPPKVAATGDVAKVPRAPKEKACLPPPTEVDEDGMVASAGLDAEAVRAVMRGAVQNTLKCFAGSPSTTLMLSLNVACTGRVARVDVQDDGGAAPEVQRCVQDALKLASFPAHALPDGDTFEYPLVYTAVE
jgi:hypothetical protein